jgi:hypothetical protein
MRWPSWRGRRGSGPSDAPSAAQPVVESTAGAPEATGPAGTPTGYPTGAWRTARPLRPTVSLRPPTLLPLGLPDVTGTRPLLRHSVAVTVERDITVSPGRVTGLARVVTQPPEEVATFADERWLGPARQASPAAASHPVLAYLVPRALPAHERQPGLDLVHATDEFVGEARVPDQPHRAPGWLRSMTQAPVMDAIPGLPPALAAMPIQPMPTESAPVRPARVGPSRGQRTPVRRTPIQPAPGPEDAPPPLPTQSTSPPLPLPATPRRSGLGPPLPMVGPAGPDGPFVTGPPRGSGRSGTVRSRSRGGLGPPLVPAPEPPPRADQRPAREPAPHPPAPEEPEPAVAVPTEVTQAIRTAYGVEVGDVPVRSDTQARQEAQELQARAFTAGDEVVLGTAPAGDAAQRALIAHELVHLVQQRELGSALPDERSPAGRELEADAVAVEHAVLTGRPLPPLRHRPLGGPPPGVVRPVAGRVQRALTYPDTAPPPQAPPTPGQPGTGQRTTTPGTGSQPTASPQHHDNDLWHLRGTMRERWSTFGDAVAHDYADFVSSPFGIDIDQVSDLDSGGGSGGQGQGGPGGGPGGRGPGGPGGGRGPGGPGGRGRQSPNENDVWHLRGNLSERFDTFGGALLHDYENFIGSPFGIDFDQIADLDSGGGSGSGGTGAPARPNANAQPGGHDHPGAGAAVMGPPLHTDPSRPLSHTGRPQIDTDDLDLDEIAVRLYDRLRSKLRMELLLDRERAGLLSDFR